MLAWASKQEGLEGNAKEKDAGKAMTDLNRK